MYFTMEYVEGETLDARISRGGLGDEAGLQIVEQIARALHKKDRYATAAEFADDIGRYLRQESVIARVPPRPRRWLAPAAAVLALAAAAAVVVAVRGGPAEPPPKKVDVGFRISAAVTELESDI